MTLTKFREGSARELISIAVPLTLTSLSVWMMIFVDRLLLAHYSTGALCAAANASTLGLAIVVGFAFLTSIAEVFVARSNGAYEEGKLGKPVWQMIYVSLATSLFFIPIGLFGGNLLFQDALAQQEKDYFSVMVLFGPFHCLYAALAAFWIGRGKIGVITALASIANIVNVVLDIAFIFGIKGVLPAMGTKGAAIATSIGIVLEVVVLGYLFLRKGNRVRYGTSDARIDKILMKSCFRVGVPTAVFVALEWVAWAIFYKMMTAVSETHITVVAICQSVANLLWCVGEGLSKATLTIAANMIGAGRIYNVNKVIKASLKVLVGVLAIYFLIPALVGWDRVIAGFIDLSSRPDGAVLRHTLIISLQYTLFYAFFEALRAAVSGILTAAGDTMFLLIGGTASVWIGLLVPIEMVVVKGGGSPETANLICMVYAGVTAWLYFVRFNRGNWKDITVAAR